MDAQIVAAHTEDGVTVLDVEIGGRAGSVTFFFVSDIHVDSPFCRVNTFQEHMRWAVAHGAYILTFGDIFDAMNGRYDPRRSPETLRPEFRGREDYYDAVLDYAWDILAPFSQRILFLGQGNHELSVRKHASTDLIARLAERHNRGRTAPPCQVGEYAGHIAIRLLAKGRPRGVTRLYYSHGAGGSAPVTRGVIRTNRQAVFLDRVDVVVNGHNHQGYIVPIPKEYIGRNYALSRRLVWFLRTPGYKDEWTYGNGWAKQKNTGPHPLGGILATLQLDGDTLEWQMHTKFTA